MEVERRDGQTLAEVEPVRAGAVRTGVELESTATGLPRFCLQMAEQSCAVAVRAGPVTGHQVVDVQLADRDCRGHHPPTGHRPAGPFLVEDGGETQPLGPALGVDAL